MTDPLLPPQPPLRQCCRGRWVDEERGRHPEGVAAERPGSARRRINGHAMEPRALIGSGAMRPTRTHHAHLRSDIASQKRC